MAKQTTGYDETTGHDDPPVIAGCDRQSHKTNRHPRLIRQSSRACPAVIPDLIGDLRTFGLAPGARRSPQNACSVDPAKLGLTEHAD